MEITLGQLINARDAILELLEIPLPSKVAYQIIRFQKQIEPDTSAFDEARIKILTPYANEQGQVDLRKLPPADAVKVTAEINEIAAETIEVEFDPLLNMEQLTDFWDARDVGIKPSLLIDVDFLFEEF